MVQGTSNDYYSHKLPAQNFDKTSKKSGYEAIQKLQQEKIKEAKKDAWGSTFKNKEHFASLHHC